MQNVRLQCVISTNAVMSFSNLLKQACAVEIAVLYAALACKQNNRYRTSARLTKTRVRCSNVNKHGTDGQTDGQTDRVRRNMRPPPREEGVQRGAKLFVISRRNFNRYSLMTYVKQTTVN